MELDERKLRILSAVVENFIATGDPVGSKLVAQLLGNQVSSATVRNDMSALFDMGLVEQPHTSAGRVPSHLGYRIYIDRLMNPTPLPKREKDELDAMFNVRNPDPDRLLEAAARQLADRTGCAAVSLMATPNTVKARRIEIIPAGERTAVILLIATNGVVRNKVIRVDFSLTPELLRFINAFANAKITGVPLEEISTGYINSVAIALGEYSRIFTPLLAAIFELCREVSDGSYTVVGQSNLLSYPELQPMAHELFLLLEDKRRMSEIMERGGEDTTILVGKENPQMELSAASVVVAHYQIGAQRSGSVGIVGPVRLSYARVLPEVRYVAKLIGEILSDTLEHE